MIDHGHRLEPVWIDGGWVEIDSISDLRLAEELVRGGRLGTSE
jgi:hypothetical protein